MKTQCKAVGIQRHCWTSQQGHTVSLCMGIVAFVFFATALPIRAADFKRAIDARTLVFPQDHGSHAGFRTEWWYVTGNVKDSSGREFGYQFTIFRRAIDAESAEARGRKSKWAPSDLYLGHLAISDISGKQFISKEESRRGVLGIAGATDASDVSAQKLPRVWLAGWEMVRTENGWTLKADDGEIAMDLALTEAMPAVPNGAPGEEGLSRKGAQPGQASYYYSVPQLKTSGMLKLKGTEYKVEGRSWMDHEFGSNQLSESQAGWNWFAIELDDGSALMLYLLRHKDGSIEPLSSGTWIEPNGKGTHLPLAEIKTTGGHEWISGHSGGHYLLEWHIEVAGKGIDLKVVPAQEDQEIRGKSATGLSYYEGAIHVQGTVNGKPVSGAGYLEITGAPGQNSSGVQALGGLL